MKNANTAKVRKERHSKGEFRVTAKERFPKLIKNIRTLTPHIPSTVSKYQIEFRKKLNDSEKKAFQDFITDFFEVGFKWNHSDLLNWYNTVDTNIVENGKKKNERTVLLLTIF